METSCSANKAQMHSTVVSLALVRKWAWTSNPGGGLTTGIDDAKESFRSMEAVHAIFNGMHAINQPMKMELLHFAKAGKLQRIKLSGLSNPFIFLFIQKNGIGPFG